MQASTLLTCGAAATCRRVVADGWPGAVQGGSKIDAKLDADVVHNRVEAYVCRGTGGREMELQRFCVVSCHALVVRLEPMLAGPHLGVATGLSRLSHVKAHGPRIGYCRCA
jgi:hypothetical protein